MMFLSFCLAKTIADDFIAEIQTLRKDYSWNSNTCICENSKHLRSFADILVTECDEIVIVMDNLLTNNANTIAADIMVTASINCHSKKIKDCYILHTV